jgi:hypothetical protein
MPTKPAVISASAAVTTSASCAASLPNDGNCYWYCSGFEITSGGATAGGIVAATITGLLGGTLNYKFAVPTGVTLAANPMFCEFNSALAGVSPSTDVVLTLAAAGAGNTGAAVVIHGFKGPRQLG